MNCEALMNIQRETKLAYNVLNATVALITKHISERQSRGEPLWEILTHDGLKFIAYKLEHESPFFTSDIFTPGSNFVEVLKSLIPLVNSYATTFVLNLDEDLPSDGYGEGEATLNTFFERDNIRNYLFDYISNSEASIEFVQSCVNLSLLDHIELKDVGVSDSCIEKCARKLEQEIQKPSVGDQHLIDLIGEIQATGGLVKVSEGVFAPACDETWTSLGITIHNAYQHLLSTGVKVELDINSEMADLPVD